VAWSSRLQRSISQSTTEAEFVSLNEATREAVVEAHPEKKLTLTTLNLVHNPENHQRTKHIEVKFLYEQHQNGKVDVIYVGTKDQLADGLTKGLP
jgi:hypothetical protein